LALLILGILSYFGVKIENVLQLVEVTPPGPLKLHPTLMLCPLYARSRIASG